MDEQLPQSPVDPLAAETALAAIGLKPILDCEPTWNALTKHKAAMLPKVVKKLVAQFVAGDRAATEDLPKFDDKKVGKLLAEGPSDKQALALSEAIKDPVLGLAVAAVATRIVHQLQPLFPRRTRRTSMGLVADVASPGAIADFARVWSVACDPMIVIRDLVEGSLSPDMVRALEMLYPNFYTMVTTLAEEARANLKAKRPNWELDGKKDRLMGVLLGRATSTSDLPLAADFQALAQQQATSSAPPSARPVNFKSDLATPGQTGSAS